MKRVAIESTYMAIYLDTETTGLSAKRGATIVEIAIVDEWGETLMDTLVDPKVMIPWGASKVHGITDSMVRGKPTLEDLMPEVRRIIRDEHVVIYNSDFDAPFFPGSLSEASRIECAMRQFSRSIGVSSWRKLDYAAAHVGHTWSGVAHRALADALACRSVWRWIQKKSANSVSSDNCQALIRPCPFCAKRLRMPSGKLLNVTCPSCRATFQLQT